MKTVGEILSEKRRSLGLSLELVEEETKIRKNFLEALEKNEFSRISGIATIKGFLRNYAVFLGLSPDNVLAIFRRDFVENEKGQVIPRTILEPLSKKQFFWTPKMTFLSFLCFLTVGIVFFLARQYQKVNQAPFLEVSSPKSGEVFNQSVFVSGKTDKDATVKINGILISVDQNGQFSEKITLPRGENNLIVEAVNRKGKKRTVSLVVIIE